MARIVGGVVAGYLVMFVAVFLLLGGAYVILGASGSFQPGTWEVTTTWLVVMIVVSLVAAAAGGYVARAIARDPRGTLGLVILVIVLGILFAIPVLTSAPEAALTPRPDIVPWTDAMQQAHQPVWAALLNPVLGAVGAFIGGQWRDRG